MQKQCCQCNASFTITDEDLKFYARIAPSFNGKKYPVPPPEECPLCRQQRRMSWRNERTLYPRNCDLCKKHIISIYPADSEFTVYCNACWWSDKWDARGFGRDFDHKRDFMTQFKELQLTVPRLAIYLKNSINSDFSNHSENLKNCYLSVCVAESEGVHYSKWCVVNCTDICDCYQLGESELCYETQYSEQGYGLIEAFCSDGSRDSAFVYDCQQCRNCFFCWNLRHREYCFKNEQLSRSEYEEKMKDIDLGSYRQYEQYKKQHRELVKNSAIIRANKTNLCENCTGNMLYKDKNVKESFGVTDSEDCKFCYDDIGLKDSYDTYEAGFNCELQYNSHACNRGMRTIAGHVSYDVNSIFYVDSCHNSSDLFGCVGMRRAQYCVLNKQYARTEYEKIASQIVESMLENPGSCRFGEFFPISLSPFRYGETVAQEYFPLKNEEEKRNYQPATCEIPDNIKDVTDGITDETLACIGCGRNYRIILAELKFYRRINIPIPRKCFICRHVERMKMTNLPILHDNNCRKCGKLIRTSYSKNCRENIYCQECYLKEVY